MYEYTYQNHFKYGYNNSSYYRSRSKLEEKFTAEFGRALIPNLNWREANNLAAVRIYEKKVGDIYVLLSGGMDSEICLKSFVDQKLPVKTISLKFLDIDQSKELEHINRIVKEYDVPHHFEEIHVKKFVTSSEFLNTIDNIKCVSPIIGCHLWLANQLEGTPVIAQGEVHLKKEIPEDYIPGKSEYLKSSWHLYESERLCSIYQNFINRGKPAIPGFFQYLPEQFLSFLTLNPILTQLVNNQLIGKLGTRSSKNEMSAQFYPEIPLRQKLHGWESEQDYHDTIRKELGEKYKNNDSYYKIELEQLITMLRPNQ